MSNDDELKRALEKEALRRARITSIVLGTIAVIAILSVIFGLTQQIEAKRQREVAEQQIKAAEECSRQLDQANNKLRIAMKEAELAMARAMEAEMKTKSSK